MTLIGPICDCGHSPLSHIHAYAPRLSMCKVSGCRCNALSYALGRSTPDTLTDAQLDEIEARSNAATPGPWEYTSGFYGWDMGVFPVGAPDKLNQVVFANNGHGNGDPSNEDAAFIAHARADVPALVAALRESRERERRLIEVVRGFLGRDSWCAGQHDHADDVNACSCGYAQLRDVFNSARAALGEREAT